MHGGFFPCSHQHFPKLKARPHSPVFSISSEDWGFQSMSAVTRADKTSPIGCSHHSHVMLSTCGCRNSFWHLPGELSFSDLNEKATARKLPRATDVNAMTAPGWKTKDRKMKGRTDEPSSVLTLVVHFPLLRRFKASATAVNLASPARGGWFKSALEWCIRGGWQEGFSFVCFFK